MGCSAVQNPKEGQLSSSQHRGVGVVVAVNPSKPSVEINHQEMKDFMPAMQMEFYVKDKSLLDSIRPGDKVNFTIDVNSGIEVVSAIGKEQ